MTAYWLNQQKFWPHEKDQIFLSEFNTQLYAWLIHVALLTSSNIWKIQSRKYNYVRSELELGTFDVIASNEPSRFTGSPGTKTVEWIPTKRC